MTNENIWSQNKGTDQDYPMSSLHKPMGDGFRSGKIFSFCLRIAVCLQINPSAWGHLNPSSYCDVGRLFYGVFKLWSKLQRKKMKK